MARIYDERKSLGLLSGLERPHEARLWCAVILQAIDDARSRRTSTQATREREEALQWLLTPNADFEAVCALAQIDPDAVRDKVMTGGGSKLFEKAALTGPHPPYKISPK